MGDCHPKIGASKKDSSFNQERHIQIKSKGGLKKQRMGSDHGEMFKIKHDDIKNVQAGPGQKKVRFKSEQSVLKDNHDSEKDNSQAKLQRLKIDYREQQNKQIEKKQQAEAHHKPEQESHQQAINNLMKVFQNLRCKGMNLIKNMCSSPQCQNPSLHCEVLDCEDCKKKHEICSSIRLQKWINLASIKIRVIQQFYEKIESIQLELIQKFRDIKKQCIEVIKFGWIDKPYADILKNVFLNKNYDELKAKDVLKITEKMWAKSQVIKKENQTQILNNFLLESEKIITKYKNLKVWTLHDLIGKQRFKSDITKQLEDQQFLKIWLKNPVKVQLIFRASEHQFSTFKFHKICDNIPHTLIIIKTEFGKILGGYTPLTWNSSVNSYSKDASQGTFIFSLDLKQKMNLQHKERAIYCSNTYGPTFGGGPDIYISNQCNKNKDSYTSFPNSYNNSSRYKNNQQSYTAFCGAPSGYNFKVLDYEVFKVSWQ